MPLAIDDPGGMIGPDMHAWGSTMAAIERADIIIMTLDPAVAACRRQGAA